MKPTRIFRDTGDTEALSVAPRRRLIAFVGKKGRIDLLESGSAKRLGPLAKEGQHYAYLCFDKSESKLLAICQSGVCDVWSVPSLRLIDSIKAPPLNDQVRHIPFSGAAWSDSGKYLALWCDSGCEIVEAQTHVLRTQLRGVGVGSVAVRWVGDEAYSIGSDGLISKWKSGAPWHTVATARWFERIGFGDVSEDGSWAVLGGKEYMEALSLRTGKVTGLWGSSENYWAARIWKDAVVISVREIMR